MSIEAIEVGSVEAAYGYLETTEVEEKNLDTLVSLEEVTAPSDNLAMLRAEENLIRGQKAQTPVLRSLTIAQQKKLDAILS